MCSCAVFGSHYGASWDCINCSFFLMKLHPKKWFQPMGVGIQTKAGVKQNPQNRHSVGTGNTDFPGGIAPAGVCCSLFYTWPKTQEGAHNGLGLRGV